MAKYQFGCLKAEIGVMDPEDGTIEWGAEIDIYQDSIVMDEPEATKTEHYKQGDPDPKVTRYGRTAKTIAFSIMDMSAASKAVWLGGTVTTVTGVDTWNAPAQPVKSTQKALRFTLEDGSIIIVPNAECAARLSSNLNETDIALMPVVATVKSTGVESVSAFQWTDAA